MDVSPEFWQQRERANVHIMFYEDVVKNPEQQTKELALFLGKVLSDQRVALISEKSRFSQMKKNDATNEKLFTIAKGFEFIRNGKVGDWKNYFTVAQNEWMDGRLGEKHGGTGLEFQYE